MSEGFVSINPANAVAGGGLLDDIDVLIKTVRTAMWDYNGQIKTPIVALAVTFQDEESGGETVQYYSAGDPKHFVPSQDGKRFVPVGTATGLNENTNAMVFLVSLINAGFPGDKVTDDVSVFEGTRVHVGRIPQPKRPGLQGGDKQNTVLVVNKIHGLPWDKPAAQQAQAKTKKAVGAIPSLGTIAPSMPTAVSGASVPVESNGELHAKAMEGMVAIVAGKGGMIPKAQIAQEAFKFFAKDPDRNGLVQMIYSDQFLAQAGAPWTFDGTTVKLG